MKENYEELEMQTIEFDEEDIITTSPGGEGGGEGGW